MEIDDCMENFLSDFLEKSSGFLDEIFSKKFFESDLLD
jgi:hypothetical protein